MRLKEVFYLVLGMLFVVSNAYSAVYHIDPTSNSDGDGSALRPFRSWFELPTMKTGDDVFFKCNTTSSPPRSLNVSWEGTAENPAIIGSYYMEGANARYGINGKRPIISGSNYTVPENACYGTSDSWDGMIKVVNKNYVHIRNLHVYQSGFMGISVRGDTNLGKNSAYFLIQNVKIEGSYWNGIMVNNNPKNYGVIEDCEVSGAAYAFKAGCAAFTGALTIANTPFSNTTVRRNYVHENWGEGIGSNRVGYGSDTDNSGHAIIEDNLIWNNRRVDIYVDRTENNIIRRNKCLGADGTNAANYSSTFENGRSWNQFGIWINTEMRGQLDSVTNNNKIYNNMVAGHYSGIGIASDYTSGTMENNVFYNNTLIGNRYNISIGHKISGYNTNNITFKNNVSYCPPDTICDDVRIDWDWIKSKISSDYNAWTKKPSSMGKPNDVILNQNWGKTQAWQDLGSIPSITAFAPLDGSPVIDAGIALPKEYGDGIDALKTVFLGSRSNISVVTTAQDLNGTRWDMGAVVFPNSKAGQAESTLSPPTLTIMPSGN